MVGLDSAETATAAADANVTEGDGPWTGVYGDRDMTLSHRRAEGVLAMTCISSADDDAM